MVRPIFLQYYSGIGYLLLYQPYVFRSIITKKLNYILRLALKYYMVHYIIDFKLMLTIHFTLWRLLPQPTILELPVKIHMKYCVNLSQGSAISEIQLVSNWSYMIYNNKWPYIMILKFPWQLQLKFLVLHKTLCPISYCTSLQCLSVYHFCIFWAWNNC